MGKAPARRPFAAQIDGHHAQVGVAQGRPADGQQVADARTQVDRGVFGKRLGQYSLDWGADDAVGQRQGAFGGGIYVQDAIVGIDDDGPSVICSKMMSR